MAKLTHVPTGTQESALKVAQKTHQTLSGGLNLPEGIYQFQVAEKNAFGILEVNEKWALPIVAGSMKVDGKSESFVLSDQSGAKTLVVPDTFFVSMSANATYNITIGTRKGRKVVTLVEPFEFEENVISDDKVSKSTRTKEKEPAF